MCTTDLCNANDFNFHTERANQLFGLNQAEAIEDSKSSTSKHAVTIVTPSPIEDRTLEEVEVTKILERDLERTETLWSEQNSVDLVGDETVDNPRSPRQTQGNILTISSSAIIRKLVHECKQLSNIYFRSPFLNTKIWF